MRKGVTGPRFRHCCRGGTTTAVAFYLTLGDGSRIHCSFSRSFSALATRSSPCSATKWTPPRAPDRQFYRQKDRSFRNNGTQKMEKHRLLAPANDRTDEESTFLLGIGGSSRMTALNGYIGDIRQLTKTGKSGPLARFANTRHTDADWPRRPRPSSATNTASKSAKWSSVSGTTSSPGTATMAIGDTWTSTSSSTGAGTHASSSAKSSATFRRCARARRRPQPSRRWPRREPTAESRPDVMSFFQKFGGK